MSGTLAARTGRLASWLSRGGRLLGLLSLLLTGTLLSSLLAFATQLLLARTLSVADVGHLAALLAAVSFCTPLGAAGVNWLLLQAYGREGSDAARWLRPAGLLVAVASCIAGSGLLGYAALGVAEGPWRAAALLACVPILLGQVVVELAYVRFQLERRYAALAAWQSVTQAGRSAAVLALVATTGMSLEHVAAAYALVGLATAAGGALLLRTMWQGRLRLAERATTPEDPAEVEGRPTLRRTAAMALPFALMTMFYVLFFQGGLLVLELLRGGAAAGTYNAAFLVYSALLLVPAVVYTKLLAAPLYRWAVHDRAMFRAVFHLGVVGMLALGLLLAAVTAAGAPVVIRLLFGERYADAVPVLVILAAGVPLRFMQHAYSSLFASPSETVRKVRYLGFTSAVAVGASITLVPAFGAEGAAAATVLAEAILLLLHVRGTARHIEGISARDSFRLGALTESLRRLTAPPADRG